MPYDETNAATPDAKAVQESLAQPNAPAAKEKLKEMSYDDASQALAPAPATAEAKAEPVAPAAVGNPEGEKRLVSEMLASGEKSETKITDAVFFARSPNAAGKQLSKGSPEAKAWLEIRDGLVRPAIAASAAPEAKPAAVEEKKAPAPAEPAPEEHKVGEEAAAAGSPKPLKADKVASAKGYYEKNAARYPAAVITEIRASLKLPVGAGFDEECIQGVARFQSEKGLSVDGKAGGGTLAAMFGKDIRPAESSPAAAAPTSGGGLMKGNLDPSKVKEGKPTGAFNLVERRINTSVFGEPLPEELVQEGKWVHSLMIDAYHQLKAAAMGAGIPEEHLRIVSGYRSVADQKAIWAKGLAKTKAANPEMSEEDAVKATRKWVAPPGGSPHHTGLAIDLSVPGVGQRGEVSKQGATYAWLAQNAASFGFYPYLAEGWHWEYNGPGVVEQVKQMREDLIAKGRALESPTTVKETAAVGETA